MVDSLSPEQRTADVAKVSEPVPFARNISNSEVITWLTCRRKYYFAHYLNLEPNEMSLPLYRGNIGHEAFQRYTEARLEGHDHEKSMTFARALFDREVKEKPQNIETILQTMGIFEGYMGYHQGWPQWRLKQPEQRFDLKLTDELTMTIRYDAMIEEITTGKQFIGDYKFTFDFWTQDEHNINVQMPKYISVMRANGFEIHGGFLEELRTRSLSKAKSHDPKEKWKRTLYLPSNTKRANAIRQHIAASLEISEYWQLPDAQREAKTIPVLNKYTCKGCPFIGPCTTMLDGGDPAYTLETQFKENTYGYNTEEAKELT